MPLDYPLINATDAPITDTGLSGEFRIPISGKEGSTTSAFHLTVNPGEVIASHRNNQCEEISICVSGTGKVVIGNESFGIREGHCMRIPMGVTHQFENNAEEPTQIVGFYIGAETLSERGFETTESIGDAKTDEEFVLHWDDVIPENMNKDEGWHINDFRLPFGTHNGSSTTLFRAQFFPGAVHKKHSHENCEEIYYLISGHGLAGAGNDRVEVTAGQFHYIPRGVEHWLYNLSDSEPIHVIGIYIGSGSVAETGYMYRGDVTPEDVAARST